MDLLLYGFGGFGYSVAEIAIELGFKKIGVFDDIKPYNLKIKNGEIQYLGTYNPEIFSNIPLLITIGNNEIRAKISEKVKHNSLSLLHPSAKISENCSIETGCIIMQNAVIQCNSIIKNNCIINTSSVIDHDCVIENFVHIRPMVYVGSNSSISSFNTINPCTFIERFSKI